ncbi:hypothetical protein SDC9_168155 [bioreactor metagenome]|uniref:Uncharacterized protein n=1 Tax=bioreactor metagenome TaxID=1076179 RepID=A0A645G3R5_9ZZZZ
MDEDGADLRESRGQPLDLSDAGDRAEDGADYQADDDLDAEGWRLDSVCLGLIRGCGHGSPEQRSGPQLSQRPRHGKRGRLTKGCLEVQLRRCRMAVGQRHAALKVSARSMYSRHHIILSDSFLHLIARQRSRQSVTLGRDSPAGK